MQFEDGLEGAQNQGFGGIAVPLMQEQVVYQKGWSSTGWKIGGAIFAVVVLFVSGIFYVTFSMIGRSGAVTKAMEEAQKNPVLVEKLGQPITHGLFVFGRVNVSGDEGYARVVIPISGPKGKASLYVVARKRFDEWSFRELKAAVKGDHEEINLLPAKKASGSY